MNYLDIAQFQPVAGDCCRLQFTCDKAVQNMPIPPTALILCYTTLSFDKHKQLVKIFRINTEHNSMVAYGTHGHLGDMINRCAVSSVSKYAHLHLLSAFNCRKICCRSTGEN